MSIVSKLNASRVKLLSPWRKRRIFFSELKASKPRSWVGPLIGGNLVGLLIALLCNLLANSAGGPVELNSPADLWRLMGSHVVSAITVWSAMGVAATQVVAIVFSDRRTADIQHEDAGYALERIRIANFGYGLGVFAIGVAYAYVWGNAEQSQASPVDKIIVLALAEGLLFLVMRIRASRQDQMMVAANQLPYLHAKHGKLLLWQRFRWGIRAKAKTSKLHIAFAVILFFLLVIVLAGGGAWLFRRDANPGTEMVVETYLVWLELVISIAVLLGGIYVVGQVLSVALTSEAVSLIAWGASIFAVIMLWHAPQEEGWDWFAVTSAVSWFALVGPFLLYRYPRAKWWRRTAVFLTWPWHIARKFIHGYAATLRAEQIQRLTKIADGTHDSLNGK